MTFYWINLSIQRIYWMCQYILELLFIQLLHKHCLLPYWFDVGFFFFWCNSTYVGNKVGIYFSVNRSSCISRQLPMPSWPMPLIKKPLLALVSLSKSPSSHLCVSVCARGSLPKRTCQLNGYHWDQKGVFSTTLFFGFYLYSYIFNHKYAQLE